MPQGLLQNPPDGGKLRLMKRVLLASALLALAACAEEAGKSTYFDTINTPTNAYEAQQRSASQDAAARVQAQNREALRQSDALIVQSNPGGTEPLIQRVEGNDAALTAALSRAITEAEAGTQVAGVQPQAGQAPLAGAGVQTASRNPQVGNNPPDPSVSITNEAGITDNSFSRIKRRDSIETDAERLAAAQSQLVVIEPEPLPARAKANVAAFAMATSHSPGQRVYRRGAGTRGERASGCGRYRSKDEAQRAFLAAGGPDQDRLGLDPDGDGFVCGWSPMPYRSLQSQSNG